MTTRTGLASGRALSAGSMTGRPTCRTASGATALHCLSWRGTAARAGARAGETRHACRAARVGSGSRPPGSTAGAAGAAGATRPHPVSRAAMAFSADARQGRSRPRLEAAVRRVAGPQAVAAASSIASRCAAARRTGPAATRSVALAVVAPTGIAVGHAEAFGRWCRKPFGHGRR